MRLKYEDILNKHKNIPCVIAGHGPSLINYKEKITEAHNNKKIIRFSVNNWWDYFTNNPDYWVLSSTEFTIAKYLNFLNEKRITVLFSDDGDFTSKKFIEENSIFDWLDYDQRHWKGKDCLQILRDFKEYYVKNKNFDFKDYGNNSSMWQPPRHLSNFGLATDGKCCSMNTPKRVTIQEYLMKLSGHNEHYSTADTVSFHAIAFAIIMGCNPIYVAGMDLDYSKGYADKTKTDWMHKELGPNSWTPTRINLENDIKILNDSAKKRGLSIINLNKESWYNTLEFGDFLV